jgi:hypothetical protein
MKQLSYNIVRVPSIDILYEGTKSIYKTNCHIDIIIAYHKSSRICEVITYEPEKDYEAPRIYLNSDIIRGQLDPNELSKATDILMEKCLRARKPFTMADIHKISERNALINYILSRIQIKRVSPRPDVDENDSPTKPFAIDFDTTYYSVKDGNFQKADTVYNGESPFPYSVNPLAVIFRKNCE